MGPIFPLLSKAAFAHPIIDNHTHPLLTEKHRDAFPFEGVISEATAEAHTVSDARTTLACYRATAELSKLFGLKGNEATWESVKKKRASLRYPELCDICMKSTGIQCLLIDDGLGGVPDLAESYKWHDKFTTSPTKRIVRIEVEAQDILRDMFAARYPNLSTSVVSVVDILEELTDRFKKCITAHAKDDQVVGFKSVACYRTGLDIATTATDVDIEKSLLELLTRYIQKGDTRLQHKELNDHLVRIVLQIAGQYKKPGLGDNDITLTKSSPAHMQPIIKAYPDTTFILLHSSYPYTRDAGYLAAVYQNVYLDFGQVFPFLSGDGQRAVIRQVLELAPTNKILWSTDGHWWPESYYLACVQAREALYEVLADSVRRKELTEEQAIEIVQNVLFHNSNRVYQLGLEPDTDLI